MKLPEALKEAFPLVFTAFVNKCGQIGLSLLPMLLVEKKLGVGEASLVLGTVKASALLGIFLGGYFADKWGLRLSLVSSFLFTGFGLGILPVSEGIILISALAIMAQVGHMMYPSAARLMLNQTISRTRLQEGVGWLRTANNAGMIVSYGLGILFSPYSNSSSHFMNWSLEFGGWSFAT